MSYFAFDMDEAIAELYSVFYCITSLRLEEALQAAKNYNFNRNGDRLNAFKFGLMGDPAMRIVQPKYQINCKKTYN